MVEIKVELDELTLKASQKAVEIWGRMDYFKSPFGANIALSCDIWTGWSGLLTTMLLFHPDWKWPLWVREQNRMDSPGYIPAGSSFGAGCTSNRNYKSFSMVGVADREHEAVVGMDGTVMPRKDAYSVSFWLYEEGKLLAVGEEGKIQQERIDGYLPIISTVWRLPEIELRLLSYADSIAGQDICFTKISLKNISSKKKNLTLFAVVTPWGPDEFHPVTEISYNEKLSSFLVKGQLGVVFEKPPTGYTCMNLDDGDVCVDAFDGKLSMKVESKCEVGYCTAAASFDLAIDPLEKKDVVVKQLMDEIVPEDNLVETIKKADFDKYLSKVTEYWKNLLKKGIDIKVPDKLVVDTYKSILIDLHLLKDGENITPGPTIYHGDWIRDRAHLLFGLELAGFHKAAHECMEYFKKAQRQDGYFWHSTADSLKDEETIMEYDSVGEAIWTIVQHYKFIKDKNWLKEFYPNIKRGIQFLSKIRKETMTSDGERSLHYGLIPKSWSAEYGGPCDYIYYDDFWSICGFRNAIYAARELGLEEDAKWMTAECQDLERCVWGSIDLAIKKRGLECFPASPYQDISSTIIANISCLWPCKVVNPKDERLGKVLEVLYSRFMPNGCYFHSLMGGYTPIFAWPVANCFVQRRENQKALRIFRWTLENMQSPTHTQPEGIHPATFCGCEGDGISLWAGVECFMLIRNMLVLEQDNTLWITPCIPREWLADGKVIEINQAPTFYGELNYRIESKVADNVINMEVNLNGEGPKKGYIFYLNHPAEKEIRSVKIDRKEWKDFEKAQVKLPREAKRIEVYF